MCNTLARFNGLPLPSAFVILRTINSKYFQHLGLLGSFLKLGLGFFTGKVSGSDSIAPE